MGRQYALIVGSGLSGFGEDADRQDVNTPFGAPSAAVRTLRFDAHPVLVLSRHGEAHTLPPHAINYRANAYALKALGAESVIALNTVGAVNRGREPGSLALPDQLIDYTWGRAHTVHDGNELHFDHIDFTEPFTARLRGQLLAAARSAGLDCYDDGVYAVTQGPRLETAAEVDRLERDGADYVGMTCMPEAALARELGLEYACLSMIVNLAAGRGEVPIHDDVESNMASAKAQAIRLLQQFFRDIDGN
jgi:purine nucleoside phosphorylase